MVISGVFYTGSNLFTFLEAFEFINTVKILCLERINLDEKNSDILFTALSNVTELSELNLSNNSISIGVATLDKVLKSNKNLNRISLNNCNINDKAFYFIVEILVENTSLFFIDLNRNKITDESGKGLGLILENNKTLKTIQFLENKIQLGNIKYFLPSTEWYRCVLEY